MSQEHTISAPIMVAIAVVGVGLLVWAIVITVYYSKEKNKNCAESNNQDDPSSGAGGGGTIPAGSVVALSSMSLNILTAGKDGFLNEQNKWAARKADIKTFIESSNFDLIALQEVSTQLPLDVSQSTWLRTNFDSTYDIFGDPRSGASPESCPVMVRKEASLTVEAHDTVEYDTGDAGGDYPRVFTWAKITVVSNKVKLLFISTQMHRNDDYISAQKQDIQQLAAFIRSNNDNNTRQTIAVGDWNPTNKATVYHPYQDLATTADLTFDTGFQSGSNGTRPKQTPETDLNVTQYMTGSNNNLDVGSPFDVFVYSKPPMITAANLPNRYMRGASVSSGTLYSLSDHDPVMCTFIV